MTRKIFPLLWGLLTMLTYTSCEEDNSYAHLREKEEQQISSFISRGATILDPSTNTLLLKVDPIHVITEQEFEDNGQKTDVSKNEYVKFDNGLYMQIVREGIGEKLQHNETTDVLIRFVEFNISTDTIQCSNRVLAYETKEDVMSVTNTYGTIDGTFISGLMASLYGTMVPTGWLYPLHFIKLGRQDSDDEIAKVRIIVPSTIGQQNQKSNVYPCFYELTYQRGR